MACLECSILTYKDDCWPSFSDDTGVCGLLSVSSFIMIKNLCSFEPDFLLLERGSGFCGLLKMTKSTTNSNLM